MRFGPELEQLFLLAGSHLEPKPDQDRILHDVARTLGGGSPQPSIARSANCVTVTAQHHNYFAFLMATCQSVGLQSLEWQDELRIFIM